tara:strand:- start:619 stop:744 length:126 start_codon:yes stop_codon:yes gene_type:complete
MIGMHMRGDFLKIAVVVIAAGTLITAVFWPNYNLGGGFQGA